MNKKYIDLKIVAFLSGAIIMILEILGFRILAPYFGYSVYVSGSLIGIVMVGLSLGYFLGGHLADRRPDQIILYKLLFAADLYVIMISFSYSPLLKMFAQLGVIYGSVVSAFVLFAPSMVLLGMVPPFIIRLITKDPAVVGSVAGDITAIGTIGSIVGTFGATFFLIPGIGSHFSMYLCSILLLLCSVWGLVAKRKSYAFLLLFVFVFNVFPNETESNVIFQKESVYNQVKVKKLYGSKLVLFLNSNDWFQSIFDPNSKLADHYYDYLNIAPMLTNTKEILVLGMGAGTSVKQFSRFFDVNIDAVEIDPVVIEVGEKYFGLQQSSRVNIYQEDARPFLQNSVKKYDVIELDMYQGGPYAPFYVLTKEFFQEVYDHLSPEGVMAINVLSLYNRENGNLLLDTVGKTMGTVFPSIYKIGMKSNHLLFATKNETDLYSVRDSLAGYKGAPEMENIARSSLKVIAPLDLKADAVVLTDDKAPVAEITYKMLSGVVGSPAVVH